MFAADARKHTPGKNAEKENFSMRILVCDDDAAFAGQLAEKIEAIVKPQMPRSTVDCATDAAQLRALPLAKFDLAFLDIDMGKRICKLRRDAHLSQKQLGEKIGKSASTIGSYENDTAVPTLENAAALAEALHVSLDYLLYGEKSRTLPLQKMSENRVQLLTDLAQEFAAPTSHGAAFSDRKLDILRRLYQEFYR